MDKSVRTYLHHNKHLKRFVRYHPIWYRHLSRDPRAVVNIEKEAKHFYGQTFTQKLDKFQEKIHLVEMLLNFSDIIKD